MADVKKVVEIEIDVNTGDVKKLNKEIEKTGKSAKAAEKQVGGIGKAFKGVGVAIKAAGIGLLLGVLAKLVDLFGQNQQVADKFAQAMNFLGVAFNDFFNFIGDNIGTVTQYFKDLFENPGEKIREIADTIKNYVMTQVNQLIRGFGKLGEAISFMLDGEWAKAWEATKEGAADVGEAFLKLNPATAVLTNVAEAVWDNRDAIAAYAESTWEASGALVDFRKQLQLLEIEQRKQQLLNQDQAEQLRQIRDDEQRSITERKKANEDLGDFLTQAAEEEIALVEKRIGLIQKEQELLGETFERELEIKNLEVEIIDIQERIRGFRSEQLTNENALIREQKDEMKSLLEEQLRLTELEIAAEEKAKQKKIEIAKQEAEAKQGLQDQTFDAAATALFALSELGVLNAKQSFEASKAFNIAEATINGIQAVQKTLATGGVLATPLAIAMGVTTAANVAAIAAQRFDAGGPTGGGGNIGNVPSAPGGLNQPNFNTVGNTGVNQLAESISAQNQPVKAYVVAQDVTTAQSLDRNRIDTASFG